ncbi:pseudouridine-5'-phosphate glycosidase [Shumkonia mesophila]|uniref:pseudouridine-5'-phosphate glycosidase n=1 Tax=Shumkonia mesophila TaxID=2838854 RepID=UPI0029349FCA|nr:pseudouridine-5'-phosphate glycosidase [Shumkonia mesophila]
MHPDLTLDPEVAEALAAGRPVVALESTLIAHGLPKPLNLETARAAEAAVRAAGALPATIAVIDGRLRVGLDGPAIERLAADPSVEKASLADLGALIARGGSGATTVAATMFCASLAGIRVFSTGGIGGVHRGAGTSFDISADLDALARFPVAVVCSGAKAILDIGATLEVLETRGVPVIGLATDRFPAFWAADSGFAAPRRAATPQDAARIAEAHWRLGFASGLVIANPPPAAVALPAEVMEKAVTVALAEAKAAGVSGKRLTPWLLSRIAGITEGRSLAANTALIAANARAGGAMAAAYAALAAGAGGSR